MREKFLLPLFTVIMAFMVPPAHAQTPETLTRSISVSGEAEIRVVPDQVLIALTAESRGPDLIETQKKNDAAVKNFVDHATQTLGVKKEHIQTDFTTLSPNYRSCNYDDELAGRCNPLQIVYYSVRKGVQIRLTDLSRYESLIAGALQSGITNIDSIQFVTTDLRKHRDAAREQAAKAAREKADAIAAVLGVKVGKPITINTQSYSAYFSHGHGGGARGFNQMAQNVVQEAAAPGGAEGESALSLGQINVTASVQVTFEIE